MSGRAQAACTSLVKGEIAYDVETCGLINPEKTFDIRIERFSFIKELPPANRKKFYDSYRGLVLTGKVVRSLAVRSGLSTEPGALNGESISLFVPPGISGCRQIQNKRLKGMVDEACCTGGGDVPCLLNSSYMLKDIQVIGEKGSSAGHRLQMELERDQDYQKAMAEFKLRRFASSITMFEKFRKNDRLDDRGYYFLAMAYRQTDQCQQAVEVLRPIYKKFLSGEYWAQNEQYIRNGTFLLARCLSRLQDEGEAVIVLQAFLLNPDKYKQEIQASISHADFGWIHRTKAYIEYRNRAMQVISSK